MASSPSPPADVAPYRLQALIDSVIELYGYNSENGAPTTDVKCAQALGSEIFVGCSNGDLLRFLLRSDGTETPGSYHLLSRQSLPQAKAIDEIVLLPSIARALIFSDRQIHFYTLPSLDPIPQTQIKPVRNVVAFAVDVQHIMRPAPPPSDPPIPVDPVDFCVIKRSSIMLYSLREQLFYHKEIPLPNGAFFAKRSGEYLCVADREQYAVVNLKAASFIPIMPISQVPMDSGPRIRPIINVVSENEFLIFSWNGASTMGLFITGEGDPVRGTLEFPAHPVSACLDGLHLVALMPDQSIQVHSIETQALVQSVPAPPVPQADEMINPAALLAAERRAIVLSAGGFLVPSKQQSSKLRLRKVRLLGRNAKPGGRTEQTSPIDLRDAAGRAMESVRGVRGDAEVVGALEGTGDLEIPEPGVASSNLEAYDVSSDSEAITAT